jgi:hypothetical protein
MFKLFALFALALLSKASHYAVLLLLNLVVFDLLALTASTLYSAGQCFHGG